MSSPPAEFSRLHPPSLNSGKATGFRWLSLISAGPKSAPSEPFRPAMVPILPIAVVAIHAALISAVPPAAAVEPVFHMGQDLEPALLALVQRLVERIGRIGDLLQRRGGRRHVV